LPYRLPRRPSAVLAHKRGFVGELPHFVFFGATFYFHFEEHGPNTKEKPGQRRGSMNDFRERKLLSAKLLFNLRNLLHSCLVPATAKPRFEPGFHDGFGNLASDHASAKRQHVGIIMFAAAAGGELA